VTKNLWTFESRVSGFERTTALELHPELSCSPMVDDFYEESGEEQLRQYVRYIKRECTDQWEADAVHIYWCVSGKATFETAPFQRHYPGKYPPDEDFLTHFTWPRHGKTGEWLDWFSLPVVNTRFADWAKALAWTPSPMQPTCPLRSIMESRSRVYSR
jgi:hypothetical protein